ncbi:hypothetical protein Val02_66870 [Virgisporangium aliadipatigenens]|uniref:ATPase AAA-type core domain-containing protein n=1 Tax=Virgisporangium aliadipatigenens TaxID=741659 RepID=A0A8J3YQX1_9ACTN|nr:hypothetical protein Val02_66870 [Virgisporangium aliadipatigenens]
MVTGQNNAGKSALLSALDVIAGQDVAGAVRFAGTQETPKVNARFLLDSQERAAIIGPHEQAQAWLDRGAASWVEWRFEASDSDLQATKVLLHWPSVNPIELGRLERNGPMYKIFGFRKPLLSGSDGPGTPLEMILESSGTADSVLENGFNNERLKPASDILHEWRSSFFHFRPFRQTLARNTPWSSAKRLNPDGSNLAEVLLHLRSNAPAKWDEVVRVMKEIVPGVGMLMLPAEETRFEIAFADEYVAEFKHNIKDLGTGVEQILMALTAGVADNMQMVVLEEPENGLNPLAQRGLLALLQDWSADGRTFAISTHSPVMLDWSSAAVLAVTRDGPSSNVRTVDDDRVAVLHDLGVRRSDYLSAERILILEGVTDEKIVSIWFPEVIRNPKVAVIAGGGGGSAAHADILATWLDHADSLGGRKVLFLRDRDELSDAQIAKLERSKIVSVLPCREIENLLFDFGAIARVLTRLTESEVSETSVRTSAYEMASKLKQTVILKRVAFDLGIHRHVDNELRAELASRDLGRSEFTAEIVGRLPTKESITHRINERWDEHSGTIGATWDDEWTMLAPGDEVLTLIWKKFAQRSYSKSGDGQRIAREMGAPPEILARIIRDFMAP